jgi:hypothetical protein
MEKSSIRDGEAYAEANITDKIRPALSKKYASLLRAIERGQDATRELALRLQAQPATIEPLKSTRVAPRKGRKTASQLIATRPDTLRRHRCEL